LESRTASNPATTRTPVTLTYVTLVMHAANDGEGGIMALITLLRRWGGAQGRRTLATLAALGIFGAGG
jgi:KUP system potassium uptake protein